MGYFDGILENKIQHLVGGGIDKTTVGA